MYNDDLSDEEFKKLMKEEMSSLIDNFNKKSERTIPNVVDNVGDFFPIKDTEYMGEVINILSQLMPDFEDYTFIIHCDNTSNVPESVSNDPWYGEKRVLIWTGSEHKYTPFNIIKNKYHHIFTNYCRDGENVTSIPLGYYSHSGSPPTLMQERLYNINFLGCLNRNRFEMASVLSKLPKWLLLLVGSWNHPKLLNLINNTVWWIRPKDYIKFTPDFAKGFDKKTYINILESSKFSFCPTGWANAETFRLYESMRAGCITFSNYLPDREYYKNIPIIQLNDNESWKHATNMVDLILNRYTKTQLQEWSDSIKKYYDDNLSPKATANIIINTLKQKQ